MKVGRSVAATPQSGGCKSSAQECGRRTLSLRTRDVNEVYLKVWIAQQFEQSPHTAEAQVPLGVRHLEHAFIIDSIKKKR